MFLFLFFFLQPEMPLAPKIQCGFCFMVFEQLDALRFHLFNEHQGFSAYCAAPQCKKVFANDANYAEHIQGNRCPVCCFKAKRRSEIERHYWMHVHKDAWPFQCEYCGYAATQRTNMEYHMGSCGSLTFQVRKGRKPIRAPAKGMDFAERDPRPQWAEQAVASPQEPSTSAGVSDMAAAHRNLRAALNAAMANRQTGKPAGSESE